MLSRSLWVLGGIKHCWLCTVAVVTVIANLLTLVLADNRAPVIDLRTLVCPTFLTLLHKFYFTDSHIPPSSTSYEFLSSASEQLA